MGIRPLGLDRGPLKHCLANWTMHLEIIDSNNYDTDQSKNQSQYREASASQTGEPKDPARALGGGETAPTLPAAMATKCEPLFSQISHGIYLACLNVITLGPWWTHMLLRCFPQHHWVTFIHCWSINSTNIYCGPAKHQEALHSKAGFSTDSTGSSVSSRSIQ